MTTVLAHVGLHKTGSTWLQSRIFENPESGFVDIASVIGRRELLDLFVRVSDLDFDASVAMGAVAPAVDRARAAGLVPVLSHERLSGYSPAGSFDRVLIADRIRQVFPDVKVLIVVREQVSLIDSMYGQYVTDGGSLGLSRFLRGAPARVGRMPGFDYDIYCFDNLVAGYRRLFGHDRVLALPFEGIQADMPRFLGAIAEFAGVDPWLPDVDESVNARHPVPVQGLRRFVNRFAVRTELSPTGMVHVRHTDELFRRLHPAFERIIPSRWDVRLRRRRIDRIARAVGDRYRVSNQRLAEMIDWDLEALGYPT
jgi:hypothetical protein